MNKKFAALDTGRTCEKKEKPCVLECCTDSVESALCAAAGGADRLELCGGLIIGGVTPSTGLFQEIRARSNIRIHVLIRPRFGDFCYSEAEIEVMCRDIEMFGKLGAEAVVTGVLRQDGSLNMEAMRRLTEAAGDMDVTLHRAFDVAKDPFETMEEAVSLGINTILTSGQAENCLKGRELLKELNERAAGRIDILAGAGIDAGAIRELAPYTGITSFHMSGKVTLESSMEYRKEGVNMGLPSLSEFEIWRTDEEKIRCARAVLDDIYGGCCK